MPRILITNTEGSGRIEEGSKAKEIEINDNNDLMLLLLLII